MPEPTSREVYKPHIVEKPASIVLTSPDPDIRQADTVIADDFKATEATQLSSAATDKADTGTADSEGVVSQAYDGWTAKGEALTVDTEGIVHEDSDVVSAKVEDVMTDSVEAALDTTDGTTAITETAKPAVEQPVAPEAATSNESDNEDDASDFEFQLVEDISGAVSHSSMLTGTPGSRLRNRQALSYFAAVEARIKELEDYVAASQNKDAVHDSLTNAEDSDTKLDEPKPDANPALQADKPISEQPSKMDVKPERWCLGPGWKTFSEFFTKVDKAVRPEPIIDVLTEPMKEYLGPPKKRQERKHQDTTLSASQHPEALQKREIHRIRINSPLICEEFAKIMDKSRAPQAGQVHLRPFKAFLVCREQLRKHCADLEAEAQALEEQIKSAVALTSDDDAERADSVYEDDDESAVDTFKHLRAFLTFVDEFLKPDIEAFQSLRSRAAKEEIPKFAFDDMWKLFAPGDVLYTPGSRQACMVHSVRGGRRQLRYREKVDTTAYKGEMEMIKFTITAFHLDFDGSMFGPVQQEITIEPYEGTRSVMKLPAYPIEYGTIETEDIKPSPNADAKTLENVVTQRGQHFVRLAKPDQAAHKDYDGPSADATQEQIDGEVIIDFEWYYQIQKDRKPSLGILDAEDEESSLDLTETYRRNCPCKVGCREQREEPTNLYLDYHIDNLVMAKAHDAMREILQWRNVSNQDALKTKYALLFPNKVYGFVLKTREWHGLDIDRIKNIDSSEQTFDDLILADGHKEIVMSLVEMHSGGTKGTEGSSAPKESQKQQRADLVRGKGKGLIILLHGVPGVGKTSTAECVAEKTNRPLYSLTCGDIGETPTKVQESLQKAFTLAYRWGCVLLLDEADVFLQQRSGSDMNRNAVVSVFLRTLEYYSGILFLTTNKVGVFDDAFKSRINVSLYYNQLNLEQSLQIWQVNLTRIKKLTPGLHCDEKELLDWVKETWDDKERIPWNGRQIHNAVRTAAALATFNEEDRMIMQLKHFKKVEKASQDFDKYLLETRGHDELELAAKSQQRMDPRKADLYSPEAVASRKPRGQQTHNGFVNRAQGVGLHNTGQQWLGSPQQAPFMTDPSRLPGNGKTYQAGTQQYIGHEQLSESQYSGIPHLPAPPYMQASSLQQRQTDGLTGLPGQQPAMYLNEHTGNTPKNLPSQTPQQQPPILGNGQIQQPAQQFLRQQYPNDESAWQATQQMPKYQGEPPKTNMHHIYEDGGPATPSPRGHG